LDRCRCERLHDIVVGRAADMDTDAPGGSTDEAIGHHSPPERYLTTHFGACLIGVLALAAVNVGFRLDREVLTEWDESLYATTAAEIVASGNWIATTFDGELDYYNSKPPLNVWLIALSFRVFGISLGSLRIPSAVAAWLTVLALMLWARRAWNGATALCAGVVLSTTFGFLYVHSGRSANTDSVFTLLTLLTVITLWSSHGHRWRLVRVGPLLAAVFLLRGMAVLMPLVILAVAEAMGTRPLRPRLLPVLCALATAMALAGLWAIARWQVDGWMFLERVFFQDFVARSAMPLDGHTGTLLYYPHVLQKDQYEWLLASVMAIVLFPVRRYVWQGPFAASGHRYGRVLLLAWAGATILIPTLMRTKVAWYLNPFFPLFALAVGASLTHGLTQPNASDRTRKRILIAVAVVAFTVAETKLVWYSVTKRTLHGSAQGLLLGEAAVLSGQRVFKSDWSRPERFIARYVTKAETATAVSIAEFLSLASAGDYLVVTRDGGSTAPLRCPSSNERYLLCQYPTTQFGITR
jgi:4-amino-4-deoxy-L-arabinose transferase-like glycosyltransferase